MAKGGRGQGAERQGPRQRHHQRYKGVMTRALYRQILARCHSRAVSWIISTSLRGPIPRDVAELRRKSKEAANRGSLEGTPLSQNTRRWCTHSWCP
jgi:hypothetical protein